MPEPFMTRFIRDTLNLRQPGVSPTTVRMHPETVKTLRLEMLGIPREEELKHPMQLYGLSILLDDRVPLDSFRIS